MTPRVHGITAERLPVLEPGSPEWQQYMTASKIAAVMEHSPYTSRFALWHEMAGTIDRPPAGTWAHRGLILEPAIADWFATAHPEAKIRRCTAYRSRRPETRWQVASPDRIIRYGDGRRPRVLEIKTSSSDWEWGPDGSTEIPVYYYDQVQWQLDCLGLDHAHVAVLLRSLEFRQYEIPRNDDYCQQLRSAATEFMDSLAAGQPPSIDPLDGHMDTYRAVRELHPDIDPDKTVQLTAEDAQEARDAARSLADAQNHQQAVKNRLIAAMGTARVAEHDGETIARRQARGTGTPYLVLSKTLTEGAAP